MSETGARQPREDGAEPEAEPAPERPFTDILCAVDGTRGSLAAVEQAAVLAGPHGHLTLLAVTAVTGAGAYRSAAISPPRAEHIMERAVEIAERLEVPCTAAIDPAGPPPRVILERAAEHELLALGAPSASWLGGELLDGVAHAALDSLSGPVLACHTLLAGGLGASERGRAGTAEPLARWVLRSARAAGDHAAKTTPWGPRQLEGSSTGPRARLSTTCPGAFCLRACG